MQDCRQDPSSLTSLWKLQAWSWSRGVVVARIVLATKRYTATRVLLDRYLELLGHFLLDLFSIAIQGNFGPVLQLLCLCRLHIGAHTLQPKQCTKAFKGRTQVAEFIFLPGLPYWLRK